MCSPKRTLKSLAPWRRSLAFLPAYTVQFLKDHSLSRYAIDGQILVVVRVREEDCFVIYSSPVFRPAERPPWTVSSPIARFEVYSKCLRIAFIVGKLAFQKEHLSRCRHSRNCNSKCARKEKSVRASHGLPPKCERNPIALRSCSALKLLGGMRPKQPRYFFARRKIGLRPSKKSNDPKLTGQPEELL